MIRLPLAIDPAHPAFEGHFPSMPIVPGAVLLDHGLRAIAAYRSTDTTGSSHCRLGAAKFLSFVRPGEPVRLEIEATDATTDEAGVDRAFRLRIFAGPADDERLAVSGNVAYERIATDEPVATGATG